MTLRVVLLTMSKRAVLLCMLMALLLLGAGPFFAQKASGAQLTSRSLLLSSNVPADFNVKHQLTFTLATAGTLGSIEIQYCSNSALIEDTCTPPWGFDALNAQLVAQTGPGGFTLSPSSGVNNFILTRVPSAVLGGPTSFTFEDVINPTDPGSYYVKVFTYASADASGSSTDFGAMAFPIVAGFDVSAEVPPYLTFCNGIGIVGFDCATASGDQISLGELASATSNVAQSQLMAATNASSGYNMYVHGATMTSGNTIIPAVTNASSQVGTSQFGINLRANSLPDIGQDPEGSGTGAPTSNYNIANNFRFVSGESIATATGVQDYKKYTISYLVNVSHDQSPGVYATTLTYVCVASF